MKLVEVQDLSISYDRKIVLQDISLFIEEGDYLCIVGENGGGKSTLVKALLGLIPYTKGKIEFGIPAHDIGYLPQQTDIQVNFPASVMEVVLSGCLNASFFRPFYTSKQKQTARQNLQRLGIEHLANCCYKELSGGQQQRVLLARALFASSKMLVLDEPITGLDANVTKDFYQLLHYLNKELGIAIVMVTHDIDHAILSANKILHIYHTVHFFGSTEDYGDCEICKSWRLE